MIQQVEITLRPHARGFHLVTEEIVRQLPPLPQTGLLNLFIQHTSAALSINENCDPDVRDDMEQIFNRLIRERESWYTHTLEGWDDMPAHAKSTMIGVSLSVPVTRGQLNLGIWQGIYLCEFRNHGGPRRIVATIIGE
ncbi:secondary thiamine-phosphate synthase enzyme YjbQ [Phocaeicola coprophilus]|uniref:secondary thiamine-phosphate synthase enzyme YjbQ n=1 Tax=Phocaeicola coprophilus TaxID=387090 RepID=UPI001DD9D346|nr:secondary thiamine-phosphate synthase enzyme YjbQ [Phocaeicola coprophilus]HJE47142.1 secondary thiamine-phosphate synthase enzyme YjbQ [Phocaeicola coprophilus]